MSTSNNIKFLQLNNYENKSEEHIREIAKLIYNTDPYIYPALFINEENAIKHITEMIRSNNVMFCCNNIYVATTNGHIVGIVLWLKGSLYWDNEQFIESAKNSGAKISQYLKRVNTEYFNLYSNVLDDTITIINVCVSQDCRGKGIGKQMLNQFIDENSCKCSQFELVVIADNNSALSLYEQEGFYIIEKYNGFSIDNKNLPCYRMIKTMDK